MNKPPMMPLGPVMLDVEGLTLTAEDKNRLVNPLVGGVILFARNYKSRKQVTQLINDIKAIRTPQLLVAVDQEGGRVQRFKDEFTLLPPARSFGDLWEKDKHTAPMRAFESACTMASELLEVGVDFSFAPIFDVETVGSDVIGDRSFHHDPKVAIELLGAYIDGMHTAGMPVIAKHFPGHGGVSGDSHHCLPTDERDFNDIDSCDLLPYRELKHELQGVMAAHVQYVKCDSSIAGNSRDDLSMVGAKEVSSSIVDSVEKSLQAGCDMVLVCNAPEQADKLLAGLAYTVTEKLSYRLNTLRSKASIN